MQPAALIFDCDGTLTNSMPAHYKAWRAALSRHDLELPEERFYSLAGVPSHKIITLLADETRRQVDVEMILRDKEAEFLRWLHLIQPIEVVTRVVVQERGRLKMAVASGGLRHVILAQLRHIGFEGWFDAVVCAEDTARHKPEPDVFLEAARRLGVPPAACCVYEDADLGIEAARRAGMSWVDVREMLAAE
jgi:HAD superfamily hydrolase (TIGR01509 family)